ncbi:MAG: PepSY domain-containing protein [Pseudomonadota bacterium]
MHRTVTLAVALGVAAPAAAQEVAELKDVRIGLSQAIAAAEQAARGGRTVDAELERADGRPVYHVTVLKAEGATTFIVDGTSGQVVDSRDENALTELLEYRPPPAGGERAVPLGLAVELAETAVQGRATEAEVERSWRGDRYEVELRRPRGEVEVEISALTGEIIEVED